MSSALMFSPRAFSMIGVPPSCGFVTKWFLALGAMDIKSIGLLVVLLVSSLLNAGYFVPVFLKAFFGQPPAAEVGVTGNLENRPLILFMVVPLLITSIISIVIGIYPDLFLKIINVMVGA
jgi:multicomponent Na+:H+ antiporter subunit D